MKKLNFTYIVAGVVFGYIMYISTEQLTLSIILGVGVSFGGNTGNIFKGNKDEDEGELLTDEEDTTDNESDSN